jgi:hypothetical protein
MSKNPRLWAWLAVAYFVIGGGYFALMNPPFESPDEPAHTDYVNYVAEHLSLPNQRFPDQHVAGEGHQFPLYYALAGPLVRAICGKIELDPILNPEFKPAGGTRVDVPAYSSVGFGTPAQKTAFYAVRLFGVLLGALTILIVFACARILIPDHAAWPCWLLATLPQYQFVSGSVTNDGLTVLTAALALWMMIRAVKDGRILDWVLLGLALAVAVTTKKSNLVLVPVGLALPFFSVPRHALGSKLAAVAITFLVLLTPLFAHNLASSGDLLGSHAEWITTWGLYRPTSPFSRFMLFFFPRDVATSFYARFGWMNVGVPLLATLAFYAALIGPFIARLKTKISADHKLPQAILLAICILAFLGLVYYNLSYTQPQGRLMFPMLPALSILWGYAILRSGARTWPLPILLIGANAACLASHWRFYH